MLRDRTTGSFTSSRRWPKSQRPRRSQALYLSILFLSVRAPISSRIVTVTIRLSAARPRVVAVVQL